MISRRTVLKTSAAALAVHPLAVLAQEPPSSLLDRAREIASQPFVPPSGVLPPPFDGLSYNAFRGIRPIPGKGSVLPQGQDFAVDLLPPGLYFPDPVSIERETAEGWQDQVFSNELFSFDDRYFDAVPETSPEAGYSGLRVRYPVNAPDRLDEVAVFQGASYFRAIGEAMVYGLSARTIALGTGDPEPEEFPRFTHLRLHEAHAGRIRLEAIIDGPSLAGYLDLMLVPGPSTVMDASVTLFPRVQINSIGVAPLTSMYLKGPMRGAASDDFRPRVHDSDVLFIQNGAGERLWRPIGNPRHVETSYFADDGPAGFGLFQTSRAYEDFEDTEARYQDRPSAMVVPRGDWGTGSVVLVEIPTGTEFLDNIVAFWRPEAPLEPGGTYTYDYRIDWTLAPPATEATSGIQQSRSGREHDQPGARRFVIDFDGKPDGLTPDVSVSGVPSESLYGLSFFPLPNDRGARATFLLKPGDAPSCELRLVLRDEAGMAVSPVWLHRWTPKRDGGV